MKKTILPALAMLIVAAVMLSTASYAWFAMSNEVSATNMSVSIKSDSSFLMISKASVVDPDGSKTATEILDAVRDEQLTAAEFTKANVTDLLPTAHLTADDSPAYYSTSSSWYTKVADSPDTHVSSTASTPLTAENFAKHVMVESFYIAVASGSNAMTNLRAKVSIKDYTTDAADGDPAVRVLIVTSTDDAEFSTATVYDVDDTYMVLDGEGNDITIDLGDVPAEEAVKVDVYIYYDGNDSNIKTNNMLSIADSTISISFTADVGAEAPSN